jgi:hypothetical protein
MTTYGLTSKDVLRITLVTGALGLILLAIEIGVGHAYGTLASHRAMVMAVPVGIALGPPLVIGACGVTDIALIYDELQLRLAGRVIERRRIADLTGIALRGPAAPMVLRFRDGARMRLFAIPVPQRLALRDAILARVPDASAVTVRS